MTRSFDAHGGARDKARGARQRAVPATQPPRPPAGARFAEPRLSATYLTHAIKTAGVADVAQVASGPALRAACRREAEKPRHDAAAADAWRQIAGADPRLIRSLLAGMRVPVFAPRFARD